MQVSNNGKYRIVFGFKYFDKIENDIVRLISNELEMIVLV